MSTGLVSASPTVGANVHSKTIHSILHFNCWEERPTSINTVLATKTNKQKQNPFELLTLKLSFSFQLQKNCPKKKTFKRSETEAVLLVQSERSA